MALRTGDNQVTVVRFSLTIRDHLPLTATMEVGFGLRLNRNEREGMFDELAAALIFFTIVSLLLASAYMVTTFAR